MKRVDSLLLFLILVEFLWVSLYLIWCWLLTCCILPLLCFSMFLVSLIFPRPLSWGGVGCCQRPFQHLTGWSCGVFFFSLFIWWITMTDFCMLNHCWISGMKPTWSWWMIFYVFLNLICQYFIEYFCIIVHEGDWSVILFLSLLVWPEYQGNSSFIESLAMSLMFLLCGTISGVLILDLLWNSDRILHWNHFWWLLLFP